MRIVLSALFVLFAGVAGYAQQLFINGSGDSGTPTATLAVQLATGRIEWMLPTPAFSQLLTSADGKYLIAPVDRSLQFFDLQTSAVSTIALGAQSAQSIAKHPRLLKVYARLSDGSVSSITLQGVQPLFSGCSDGPAISADGRRLVVICSGEIVVLDAESGALIRRITPDTAVDQPVLNGDGSLVVARKHVVGGAVSSDLASWDVTYGTPYVRWGVWPPLESGYDVHAILATTATGDALLVTAGSRSLGSCPAANYRTMVIDAARLTVRRILLESSEQGVSGAFTADGRFVVLGSLYAAAPDCRTSSVRLFDTTTQRVVASTDPSFFARQSIALALASPPLPPVDLYAVVSIRTIDFSRSVKLTWRLQLGSPAVTRYIVEAGSSPGLADLARLEVSGDETSFTINNVPLGRYYVRLRAINASGDALSGELVVEVR